MDRCANLLANLADYQCFANCFKGGRFVRRPPNGTLDPATGRSPLPYGTYLRRLPNESVARFQDRLARAAYRNYCQEIVRVYGATLFASTTAVERDEVLSAFPPAVATDIDLRGTSAAAFVRRVFREALVYGWVGVLTDYPRREHIAATTRADDLASDARPYSRIVLPPALWDWSLDPVSRRFERVIVSEGYHPWYGTEVWTELTATEWRVVDDADKTLDAGSHEFGFVPLDIIVCDEASEDADDEPFGLSALRDVVDLQLELYQLASLDEDISQKSNFPFLHKKMQPELERHIGPSEDEPAGPDYVMTTEADVGWVQPDTNAAQTNLAKMHHLEQQIRQIAGIATRSEESTEAHSGTALEWEYSTRHSLVRARAESLRDGEVRLWRTYAAILGVDVDADAIRYPSDYATSPVPAEIEQLQKLAELGAPVEIRRAYLRSISLKQFSHRADLPVLLAAVDDWLATAADAQYDRGGGDDID